MGPVDPQSGAVALLKALAELGPLADSWHVVFAGRHERPWKAMLEAAVRRKGGENRVTFVSDPSVAVQRALLANAGLLVAPCLRARPPIPMMQAIAAGVPACGTKCAAPADVACTTCAPNRAALREMLRELLRRPDAERIAEAASLRDVARDRLAWSKMTDRYLALYREASR
jgi:glycosyltransferase involved in cell wall biosynthesis